MIAAVLASVLCSLPIDPLLPGSPSPLRGHTDVVTVVAFSPDGRLLASAGRDSTVRLWRMDDGTSRTLAMPKAQVNALAFSADGQWLAAGNIELLVRVFDVVSGAEVHSLAFPDAVFSLAFDPKRALLAVGGISGSAQLYETKGWRPKVTAPLVGRMLNFSGDGKTLCLSRKGGGLALVDPVTGRVRQEISTASHLPLGTLSADGTRVISWSPGEYDVRLWSTSGGKVAAVGTLAGPKPTDVFENARRPLLTSLALTPDGKTVVTTTGDGQLNVWNVAAARVEQRFPLEKYGPVAVTNDGAWVAVADGTTIKVWPLRTPRTAAP